MLDIGKRLKEKREELGLTQENVGECIGVNKATVQRYESGSIDIKRNVAISLAKVLKTSPSYIMGWTNDPSPAPKKRVIKIPVLGRVAAGIPIEAIEDIIGYEEIPEEMGMRGEFFGLQIQGDSMEPEIKSRDIVIVRKQEDATSGDIVIALVNGNDATCKRLFKYAEGIRLMPVNPVYEPLYFTNQEIAKLPIQIIGKVVENRRRYT
jgi:repressor LexA